MKALYWHGKHDIRYETLPDPQIEQPRDALIDVGSCAICGSDLHLFDSLAFGHTPAELLGYGDRAGGQVEYVRVPYADVSPVKVPEGLTDGQVLFLSAMCPTGRQAAADCDIAPTDTVAVRRALHDYTKRSGFPKPAAHMRGAANRSLAGRP